MPRVIVRETVAELPGLTSALGGLHEGDIGIIFADGSVYYWDGSAWVQLAAGTLVTGITPVSSSPYVVLPTDHILLVDATAGAITISLPLASAGTRRIEIKKIDASANIVTVTPAGADLIDGEAFQELLFEDEAFPIVSDGVTDWSVL